MELPLLQSKSRASIPPHPTQLPPRLYRNHTNPNPNYSNYPAKKKLVIVFGALFSLLFLLSAALRLRHPNPTPNPSSYGVVIYCLSNQTQVHVFASMDSRDVITKRVGVGFSDYVRIEEMVENLVEFVRKKVPRGEWGKTKVQVVGDVELERVGKEVRSVFLESFRRVLRESGFLFKDEWVTVLEGKQEAVYDWTAANYALGNLGKEPQRTNGIVKLGGTSMQVTLSSSDPELVSLSSTVKLAGITYNLYTETTPYPGQDAIQKSMGQVSKNLGTFSTSREDNAIGPCVPKGYKLKNSANQEKVVAGNFSVCTSHVKELLKRRQDKNCLQPPCEIVPSHSIKLQGKPVSLNQFFFISELFGLFPKASLSELETAGHRYCEDDWYDLKTQYNNIDDLDLANYCFSSAYVVALLHDNFGISMTDKRIGFATPGENTSPIWIFGAYVLQLMQEPVELERENTEEIVGNDAVTYLTLFTVFLIAVLGAIFLLKCQKPQVKTVYDLQKGHYIVTRLPR